MHIFVRQQNAFLAFYLSVQKDSKLDFKNILTDLDQWSTMAKSRILTTSKHTSAENNIVDYDSGKLLTKSEMSENKGSNGEGRLISFLVN